MISTLDFVAVPAQDAERSRRFYLDTLGLRADDRARFEVWTGRTCLGLWPPERLRRFSTRANGVLALGVEDVAAARYELEDRGVAFTGDTVDTGVCHLAFFADADGNDLMLHHRYAPYGAPHDAG